MYFPGIRTLCQCAGSSDSSLLRPEASDNSYGESQAVDSHVKLQELSSTNAKATASWNLLSTFRAACAGALDFICKSPPALQGLGLHPSFSHGAKTHSQNLFLFGL